MPFLNTEKDTYTIYYWYFISISKFDNLRPTIKYPLDKADNRISLTISFCEWTLVNEIVSSDQYGVWSICFDLTFYVSTDEFVVTAFLLVTDKLILTDQLQLRDKSIFLAIVLFVYMWAIWYTLWRNSNGEFINT